MKTIPFFKYQGAGNDFVIIDNRGEAYLNRENSSEIKLICDRRFGAGADGLILLEEKEGCDFEMVYFNSDGKEGSMCGNGGRCMASFAFYLGLIQKHTTFLAVDGMHEANVLNEEWVELKMSDVQVVEKGIDYYVLNTGSPHYVIFVEDLDDINVVESGQVIRYSDRFREQGINVNFVERTKEGLLVATYERGVENETLSCGTGVTAAALCNFFHSNLPISNQETDIKTKGGELKVRYSPLLDGGFSNIWLCGPAVLVFKGEFRI